MFSTSLGSALDALCAVQRPSALVILFIAILTVLLALTLALSCFCCGCLSGITIAWYIVNNEPPTPSEVVGAAVHSSRAIAPLARTAAARLAGYKQIADAKGD